jgi:isocitrate lyase
MIPNAQQQADWSDPKSISTWWSTPTQAHFHRPYSAELVASLRSPFAEFWPASVQAMKLRETFSAHYAKGTASVTIGATDVIGAHLMADAGYGECSTGAS